MAHERRVKVFCVTCSFAPDDLFFPVIVTAAVKGTWFFLSFAVGTAIFAQLDCSDGISILFAVSVAGFIFLQLIAFIHNLILLVASARGSIREPKHKFVRELLLIGVGIYIIEVMWAVYSTVAVLERETLENVSCGGFQKTFITYVVLIWLNWLELALVALVYFSCLDRCKCFCCRAVCLLQCHCCKDPIQEQITHDHHQNIKAKIKVTPTSHSLSASHLSSVFRDKICTCRRDGLNNSKNIALRDISHALEVLYHDIKTHYTVLDRLSGWMLVQKYHSQLLRHGNDNLVNDELLQATLHFLKKKRVIKTNHCVREHQLLNNDSRLPEILLYYYKFAMASFGWTIKVFLEPLSGLCSLCRDARCRCSCSCFRGEVRGEGIEESKTEVFQKATQVASIAGIHHSDVFLGKSINDIHCPTFYVCRTARHDPVTGVIKKEVVITIRGTLSVKDVMTSFTASMRDATKCQESMVEKWFLLLVKTKLTFLGVQDAYFHTGFYKSAKVILNRLRKSNLFKDLVEKENYRVVVTGTSLGAGVGAVLTLLIKQKHPQWSEGLHAYLYSVPGAVCSYELAERAEELGIITSVVGAYDIVPRVSWRALSYLKLLVTKALEETSMKKQEVLCCGSFSNWDPPIFGGSTHPIGLIDEKSDEFTLDFLELQESLPVVRRSTLDPELLKKEKENKGKMGGDVLVEDEDVQYQERRPTESKEDFQEFRKKKMQQQGHEPKIEPLAEIGPIEIASLEDGSEETERKKKVATSFLEEESHLGPLMFIPGQILHIEEGEKGDDESAARWCGIGVLGMRCCGVRCTSKRKVRANWKAREAMTGVILHPDCLVDHSPRRTFAMLQNLAHQISIPNSASNQSPCTEECSNDQSETLAAQLSLIEEDSPSVVVVPHENNITNLDDTAIQCHVEVHKESKL